MRGTGNGMGWRWSGRCSNGRSRPSRSSSHRAGVGPLHPISLLPLLLLLPSCQPNAQDDPEPRIDIENPDADSSSAPDSQPESLQPSVAIDPTPLPDPTAKPESATIEPTDKPTAATDPNDSLPVIPTTPIRVPPISNTDPTLANTASNTLAKGTFEAAEHPTKGDFTIVDDDGTPILQFDESFQTDPGPDLFVVLHVDEDLRTNTSPPAYALKDADYVAIAPLKATTGRQSYAIPAAVILEKYRSVAIWCRQFNTTFGVATLELPAQGSAELPTPAPAPVPD